MLVGRFMQQSEHRFSDANLFSATKGYVRINSHLQEQLNSVARESSPPTVASLRLQPDLIRQCRPHFLP